MMTLLLVFSFVIAFVYSIPDGYIQFERGCSWAKRPGFKSNEYIRNTPPYIKLPTATLPANFSWDSQNGLSLVTHVRNQGLPYNCGSCWAVSSVGALSDRLRIDNYRKTKTLGTPIDLSVQFALDICAENSGLDINCGSCNGGSSGLLYEALSKTGISDESCNPYLGITTSHWGESGYEKYLCRTCNRFGDCNYTQANPQMLFIVDEYGEISYEKLPTNMTMVNAMKQEIYNRGPIVCSMYAHADSFENYQGGVLTDNATYPGTTHDIALIGWGQTGQGLEYWVGRNSFGTWWGGPQKGFFLAQAGINIYNMEHTCHWATVKKAETVQIK
eukprot:503218_1